MIPIENVNEEEVEEVDQRPRETIQSVGKQFWSEVVGTYTFFYKNIIF